MPPKKLPSIHQKDKDILDKKVFSRSEKKDDVNDPVSPGCLDFSVIKGKFFFDASGISLYELVSEIADHFSVTIFVFDDIRDRKIYAQMVSDNLTQILDSVCWYCGVEYFQKDGVFYIGSNSKTVVVLPAAGIDMTIEKVFQDVTVKYINDKLVLYGEERSVSRVQNIYSDLVRKHFINVRFYVFEVVYEKNLRFGIDLEQSVKYAFSWENLLSNSYNPIQSLAISLYASVEADSDTLRLSSLVDTNLGLLSGDQLRLQIGEDEDRPVYRQSDEGSQVVSTYETFSTGLILTIKGSYTPESWIFDVEIENSEAQTDLSKSLTKLRSKSRLSENTPVSLLAQMSMQQQKESFEKGVPFLSDIPYLGYLFRVSQDRFMERKVFFVISLDPDFVAPELPSLSSDPDSLLLFLSNKIASVISWIKSN